MLLAMRRASDQKSVDVMATQPTDSPIKTP
jgi:hypothetical protein